MSPASWSKAKDKKAAKETPKSSKSSGSGNATNGVAASAYNPLSGTFHAVELLSATSASGVQINGRFQNIDETDEHAGGSQTPGLEYDAVSNNGSWSGESEDHEEKASNTPTRTEAVPGSDNDKRDKIRQKNERKHQRQKERRAQELHERCHGYVMSRKLESLAQQIVQMGFPHERATIALILNEGRVAEAVAWLLEGSEDEEACKDKNVGGNLKIDISDELAQISDMETRYHCSKQEVQRAVVTCEGDLEKAAESLREMRHDTPSAPLKLEETGDRPTVSNGKLSASSQNSRPHTKANLSPIPLKKDERDFKYVKGVVTLASTVVSGNKNGQPVKRIQSKMEWPKPQQSTAPEEKKWTATGANPSVTHSSSLPLQVSAPLGKTENRYTPAGGDYKILPSTSVREPVIMMQRPQSINAKLQPATSMSTSPPATGGNWYPTNGVDIVKPNGFLPQIPSSRSLNPNYLTTNQMYHPLLYQPQQQFVPGSSSGEPQVSSRGNGLWGKTGTVPVLAAASSLGLFSGLGSTGTSGASSPVDWSNTGSLSHFDYSNIDWSLDRGMSFPRPNMWIGLSPLTKNIAHVYDLDTAGVGVQPKIRSIQSNGSIRTVPGLQDGGVASSEMPDAGSSREWSSSFEGKDLFSYFLDSCDEQNLKRSI